MAIRDVGALRPLVASSLRSDATTIVHIEWRRDLLSTEGLPEEHPQASTPNDVEYLLAFFTIVDSTIKEVCVCTHVRMLHVRFKLKCELTCNTSLLMGGKGDD